MNKFWSFLILLALVFNISGCKKRNILSVSKDKRISKYKLKKREFLEVQNIDFEYLSTKSRLEYTDGMDQKTSGVNIRMKKDSIIWISVVPMLGIEVLRCVITKDSVKAINKFEKIYYAYSYLELSQKLNFLVSYQSFQSMLLGNLPYSEIESDSIIFDSTYSCLVQERNSLSIKNFILNKNKSLENIRILDNVTNNTMSINYYDFRQVEKFMFPFINKISLRYRSAKGLMNTYVSIEHNKVETNDKELKFPFSIPKKYDKR